MHIESLIKWKAEQLGTEKEQNEAFGKTLYSPLQQLCL